ncbi:Squalene/phytoene synthase [Cognatiyoonia koreensis]|uniref:Squalene/phytoene synthase n=1 Tax=Cognatiyoonia koreensis TaxID=364200 RepID=A0A1I0PHG9_9RHOB|nr:squalene/phytoene synthase family protein [Cognatiyoonia koreensis]SEW13863.1 Squalene/phytoene synthase [Cognatiyoonia koreensis]
MSLNACATIVEKGDPERFRAAMAAPVSARRLLFPLYAFNIEVTRAPWLTQEAMIAEMRLQWWRDALEEIGGQGQPRKHEVVDALAEVLDPEGAACLDALIAARRWDVYSDAFEDEDHLTQYLDATSGNLMWTAARLLGNADEGVVRNFAFASGTANLLRAVPDLEDRGRKPLLDGTPDGVRSFAKQALTRWRSATAERAKVSFVSGAALLAGYRAKPVLQLAARDPKSVADGSLDAGNPLGDALRFANVSLRGWWR